MILMPKRIPDSLEQTGEVGIPRPVRGNDRSPLVAQPSWLRDQWASCPLQLGQIQNPGGLVAFFRNHDNTVADVIIFRRRNFPVSLLA